MSFILSFFVSFFEFFSELFIAMGEYLFFHPLFLFFLLIPLVGLGVGLFKRLLDL